jgi:hypothetical protein
MTALRGHASPAVGLMDKGPAAASAADIEHLLRMINGFQLSQAIHAAAVLGLADRLNSGLRTTAELAEATTTDPAALYRLMRALAAIGIVDEDADHCFVLTALGSHLREDVAGTQAPMAIMIGQASHWRAWGSLIDAVRHGVTAFDHVHGCGVWDHRQKHRAEARIFDRAMAAGTERFVQAVLDAHDFSGSRHIVDVGGGDGMFLARILAAHPALEGTLFDLPHVVAEASSLLAAQGVHDRCRIDGGDFFAGVPEEGDLYFLKWILHDWDDAAAIDILRSCRKAMKPGSKLLVAEHIIAARSDSPAGAFMDLNMMVMTGGRERTRAEFAGLFAAAGLHLVTVTPTATPLTLIEGALEPS